MAGIIDQLNELKEKLEKIKPSNLKESISNNLKEISAKIKKPQDVTKVSEETLEKYASRVYSNTRVAYSVYNDIKTDPDFSNDDFKNITERIDSLSKEEYNSINNFLGTAKNPSEMVGALKEFFTQEDAFMPIFGLKRDLSKEDIQNYLMQSFIGNSKIFNGKDKVIGTEIPKERFEELAKNYSVEMVIPADFFAPKIEFISKLMKEQQDLQKSLGDGSFNNEEIREVLAQMNAKNSFIVTSMADLKKHSQYNQISAGALNKSIRVLDEKIKVKESIENLNKGPLSTEEMNRLNELKKQEEEYVIFTSDERKELENLMKREGKDKDTIDEELKKAEDNELKLERELKDTEIEKDIQKINALEDTQKSYEDLVNGFMEEGWKNAPREGIFGYLRKDIKERAEKLLTNPTLFGLPIGVTKNQVLGYVNNYQIGITGDPMDDEVIGMLKSINGIFRSKDEIAQISDSRIRAEYEFGEMHLIANHYGADLRNLLEKEPDNISEINKLKDLISDPSKRYKEFENNFPEQAHSIKMFYASKAVREKAKEKIKNEIEGKLKGLDIATLNEEDFKFGETTIFTGAEIKKLKDGLGSEERLKSAIKEKAYLIFEENLTFAKVEIDGELKLSYPEEFEGLKVELTSEELNKASESADEARLNDFIEEEIRQKQAVANKYIRRGDFEQADRIREEIELYKSEEFKISSPDRKREIIEKHNEKQKNKPPKTHFSTPQFKPLTAQEQAKKQKELEDEEKKRKKLEETQKLADSGASDEVSKRRLMGNLIYLLGNVDNVITAAQYNAQHFAKNNQRLANHLTVQVTFSGLGLCEGGIHRDTTNSLYTKFTLCEDVASFLKCKQEGAVSPQAIDLASSRIEYMVMKGAVTPDALRHLLSNKKYRTAMGIKDAETYDILCKKLEKSGVLPSIDKDGQDFNPVGKSETERFAETFEMMKKAKGFGNNFKKDNLKTDIEKEEYQSQKDQFYKNFIEARLFDTDFSKLSAKEVQALFEKGGPLDDASPSVRVWYNEKLKYAIATNNFTDPSGRRYLSADDNKYMLPDNREKDKAELFNHLAEYKELGYIPSYALTKLKNNLGISDIIEFKGMTYEEKNFYENAIKQQAEDRMSKNADRDSNSIYGPGLVRATRFDATSGKFVLDDSEKVVVYRVEDEIADRMNFGEGATALSHEESAFLHENKDRINKLREAKLEAQKLRIKAATLTDKEESDKLLKEATEKMSDALAEDFNEIYNSFVENGMDTKQAFEEASQFIQEIYSHEDAGRFIPDKAKFQEQMNEKSEVVKEARDNLKEVEAFIKANVNGKTKGMNFESLVGGFDKESGHYFLRNNSPNINEYGISLLTREDLAIKFIKSKGRDQIRLVEHMEDSPFSAKQREEENNKYIVNIRKMKKSSEPSEIKEYVNKIMFEDFMVKLIENGENIEKAMQESAQNIKNIVAGENIEDVKWSDVAENFKTSVEKQFAKTTIEKIAKDKKMYDNQIKCEKDSDGVYKFYRKGSSDPLDISKEELDKYNISVKKLVIADKVIENTPAKQKKIDQRFTDPVPDEVKSALDKAIEKSEEELINKIKNAKQDLELASKSETYGRIDIACGKIADAIQKEMEEASKIKDTKLREAKMGAVQQVLRREGLLNYMQSNQNGYSMRAEMLAKLYNNPEMQKDDIENLNKLLDKDPDKTEEELAKEIDKIDEADKEIEKVNNEAKMKKVLEEKQILSESDGMGM